jgi:hypothetical protein
VFVACRSPRFEARPLHLRDISYWVVPRFRVRLSIALTNFHAVENPALSHVSWKIFKAVYTARGKLVGESLQRNAFSVLVYCNSTSVHCVILLWPCRLSANAAYTVRSALIKRKPFSAPGRFYTTPSGISNMISVFTRLTNFYYFFGIIIFKMLAS